MPVRLEGKTAVITGGTRGLGLAIAESYAREGASVVISSRLKKNVSQAIENLQVKGYAVEGIPCDVSNLDDVKRLADLAIRKFGDFDIWVNNAAISAPYGPTIHVSIDDFIQTMKTNIFGVYFGSAVAMRHFLPKDRGKLINILGRGERGPQPMQNAYASSKAWIKSFTLAMAEEYKNSAVGIFAFNPGMMDTDLLLDVKVIKGYEKRLAPLKTVMRLISKPPEAAAQKAVWIASSATDGRTGLLVRNMGVVGMLLNVIGVSVRRLLGQSPRPIDINIETIPPAI